MEDDEREIARLNNAPVSNATFQLADEDDLADVELPVSASNGDEPTDIADGKVAPEVLWLDNTLLAHPIIGIGYFFLLWASLFSRSADLAAIFPFMFVPACIGVYWWWKTYRDDVSLSYLQSQFIIGFAPVSLAVTFLQLLSLLLWLGVVVAFIEGSKTLLGFSIGVCFYMFVAVTLVEELVKVSVAAHVREQNASRADSKSFVAGTVFMSLGLGTAQAIFMAIVIYSATRSNSEADEEVDGDESSIFLVLGAVISVAFINIPLHCLCGYLASIRVALRAFRDGSEMASSFADNVKMSLLPATIRTTFLTCLVVGTVALQVVGIVIANMLGILLVYYTYRFVIQEEGKLPQEYKARVGYLSVFNEGDGDDETEGEMEEGTLKSDDDIQMASLSS